MVLSTDLSGDLQYGRYWNNELQSYALLWNNDIDNIN